MMIGLRILFFIALLVLFVLCVAAGVMLSGYGNCCDLAVGRANVGK